MGSNFSDKFFIRVKIQIDGLAIIAFGIVEKKCNNIYLFLLLLSLISPPVIMLFMLRKLNLLPSKSITLSNLSFNFILKANSVVIKIKNISGKKNLNFIFLVKLEIKGVKKTIFNNFV